MEKLTREEVMHVANLAKLELDECEIETYSIKLKEILNKIDEINEVEVSIDDILISPVDKSCEVFNDEIGEMLDKDLVLRNAPKVYDPYIEVRGVFDE